VVICINIYWKFLEKLQLLSFLLVSVGTGSGHSSCLICLGRQIIFLVYTVSVALFWLFCYYSGPVAHLPPEADSLPAGRQGSELSLQRKAFVRNLK